MTDAAYAPINRLKPVCPEIWIVDGPTIDFGMPWPKMPFPTRMTIVRTAAGLFVHSPTALTPELEDEIAAVGEVRWIIAPNRIHHWWIPEWHEDFGEAAVYLAPRTAEQAGERIDFPFETLDRSRGYPWDAEIATLPVTGRFMTEVVFFHRPSSTLILTDLIENFEGDRLKSWLMRLMTRIGGVRDPDGSMPRDMRLTFSGPYRDGLRASVETMIEWKPARIILAHGRWYPENGVEELRRAFRWLL